MDRQGPNTGRYEDILLALLGTSPGILTETVWALARECPPIVPSHVVVLTTTLGRDFLHRRLFEDRGWTSLIDTLERAGLPVKDRLEFGPSTDSIRLFPKADHTGDLEDLVTAADSHAAADFMMRALRGFTEDPDTRVIASLAGGRKTMSALLTSCMVLLGREQDRLCHVLVSPPYDSPELEPLFLFPQPGVGHRLPGRTEPFPAEAARVELTEVPFVRVRGLYERHFHRAPSSFMTLVRRVQGLAPEAIYHPLITVDLARGHLCMDGQEVMLSGSEFALLSILAVRLKRGQLCHSWHELAEPLEELHRGRAIAPTKRWLHAFQDRAFDPKEDIRKLASSLRRKLRPQFSEPELVRHLIPDLRSPAERLYPAAKIRLRGA